MKKLAAIGVAAGLIVGLAGCGGKTIEDPYEGVSHSYAKTKDGRTLYCISWGYGMSCDWANAKSGE